MGTISPVSGRSAAEMSAAVINVIAARVNTARILLKRMCILSYSCSWQSPI
jgi:hypothetical protein